MEELGLIVVMGAVAGVIVGGWYVWHAFFSRRGRAKRRLRKAERVRIADAQDGQVAKIVGTLRIVGEPLTAPLCGLPCACYETKVEQRKSSGKSSYWATIASESDYAAELCLEDGSGTALVTLTLPQLVIKMDQHFRSGTFNDATPELEAFLARHGESSTGWVFNKTLRYKEGLFEEGETVAVLGLCRREPDPEVRSSGAGGYRERAMRLCVVEPPEGEMVLSDEVS